MATKRFIILICLLWALPTYAWSPVHLILAENASNPVMATEIGLRVALSANTQSNPLLESAAWRVVAKNSPELFEFARAKELERKAAWGQRLSTDELDVLLNSPFPGTKHAALKSRTTEDVAEKALMSSDREELCEWLRAAGLASKVPGSFYAHCTKAEEANWGPSGFKPSSEQLARRGIRLWSEVRFITADQSFERVKWDELDTELRCDARYAHAQSVFRLRQRNTAEDMHEAMLDECASAPDSHIRALYFVAKRRYDLGALDESRQRFEELLKTYPERSHADDALMYLARIARDQNERPAQKSRLNKALSSYPGGDMIFEIAWEYLEPLYRAGEFEAFLEELNSLSLPPHDNQYYSQGRLAYFEAQALLSVGRAKESQAVHLQNWKTYPASFYGPLSYLRLKEAGVDAPEFEIRNGVPVDVERPISAGLLADVGHPEWLADFLAARAKTQDEIWLSAYWADRAGRFPFSHNQIRRRVDGRPWLTTEGSTRFIERWRWGVAWPNPFAQELRDAVDAETKQAGGQRVHPALPASIMREESSFIEDIESYAGALGLMQLMPRTALGHDDDIPGDATPDRLKTAEVNIRVGADHLFWLARNFDNHPVLIAAAYNAGSGALRKWIKRYPSDDIALFVEDIPPLQTRDYTKRVIGSYIAYRILNGESVDPRIAEPPK